MRKALSDKGWAEKQAAGFANWLNFTLVGADQARHGNKGGDDDSVERDGDGAFAIKAAGVSSSPLKAMVAMVSVLKRLYIGRVCRMFREAGGWLKANWEEGGTKCTEGGGYLELNQVGGRPALREKSIHCGVQQLRTIDSALFSGNILLVSCVVGT